MMQRVSRFAPSPTTALAVVARDEVGERIKALDWQVRGIFEKMRDLFGWRLYLEMPQADLAKTIGCSRAKLQQALTVLEADGLLSVQRERQNAKKMRCNRYYLTATKASLPAKQAEIDIRERERKNISLSSISSIFSPKSQSPESQPLESQSPKQGVAAVLAEYGVSERLYGDLLKFEAGEVRRALALATEKGAGNLGGYALTCLRNGMQQAPKRRAVAAAGEDYHARLMSSPFAAWFEVS
jgi:hypothetical protein